MTETKITHLNQAYSLRIDFDLETKELDFFVLFRSDNTKAEAMGIDLVSAINDYSDVEDHLELLETVKEYIDYIQRWIGEMDIDVLIREHAFCEAEERKAESDYDIERNG